MASLFVTVVSVRTGRKKLIPADWLDHPVLGKAFRFPPSAKAADDKNSQGDAGYPEGEPTDEWTVPQLTKYAAAKDIDLGDAKRKDAILSAIQDSTRSSTEDADPGDPDTPAAGGEQEN
jgi:hypothetical protein